MAHAYEQQMWLAPEISRYDECLTIDRCLLLVNRRQGKMHSTGKTALSDRSTVVRRTSSQLSTMTGLQDIGQLYRRWFTTSATTSLVCPMAECQDHTDPDVSTMEIESRKEMSASKSILEPRLNKFSVDPCASLEEVIALASADHAPFPTPSPTTPKDRLQALIQANRYPPGQRMLFEAIDASSPELKHKEAAMGLMNALRLLHGALKTALDAPMVIQQHQHVRNKFMAEYLLLPESEQVDGISIDALIEGIKSRVGSRWRVEAMEKQIDIS